MGETSLHKQQQSETTNVLAAMKGKGAASDNWCLQLLAAGAQNWARARRHTVDTGSHPIVFFAGT